MAASKSDQPTVVAAAIKISTFGRLLGRHFLTLAGNEPNVERKKNVK